jgi:hypothetical protein
MFPLVVILHLMPLLPHSLICLDPRRSSLLTMLGTPMHRFPCPKRRGLLLGQSSCKLVLHMRLPSSTTPKTVGFSLKKKTVQRRSTATTPQSPKSTRKRLHTIMIRNTFRSHLLLQRPTRYCRRLRDPPMASRHIHKGPLHRRGEGLLRQIGSRSLTLRAADDWLWTLRLSSTSVCTEPRVGSKCTCLLTRTTKIA